MHIWTLDLCQIWSCERGRERLVSSVNGIGIFGDLNRKEGRKGGIYPAELLAHMHRETCTRTFVAALFIIS